MVYLRVSYRLAVAGREAEALADSVLLEQTIETPAAVAQRFPFVRENMMGRVGAIEAVDPHTSLATLEIPIVNASVDPAQFLNTVFGNASLHDLVQLEDFHLPGPLLERFVGPGRGIEGIRRAAGVWDRPLTCSALKPVGLSTDQLARLCGDFARGGIDIIKDDHYLSNQSFSPFEERVLTCLEAVQEVAQQTGKSAIYCPNLSGRPDSIRRQADFAQRAGVQTVMIAPFVVGLPVLEELVREYLDVPVLVHPSFAGSTRIAAPALGRLLRLFGGDAVIFANYGGRFSYSPRVCAQLAEGLRKPWGHIKPAFPVPAGGMTVERTGELVDFFGSDTILLVGGSLLLAGEQLVARTREFTQAVADAAERNRH